jgi:hypothetical protein
MVGRPASIEAETVTRPPLGVNFTAFESRLTKICFIARASADTHNTPIGNSV